MARALEPGQGRASGRSRGKPYAGYLSSYSLCYDPICKSLRGEEENMIGRLRGVIIEKQPPEVLIEVGGVGL